jgi:hypothetical protein
MEYWLGDYLLEGSESWLLLVCVSRAVSICVVPACWEVQFHESRYRLGSEDWVSAPWGAVDVVGASVL